MFRYFLPIAIIVLSTISLHGADDEAYYKQDPLFSMRASPSKSVTNITRFGPVGLSIDLIKPAFTMRIKSIEPGSPADKTAQLKPGQIIASINSETLKDIDPRIQLGNMITRAEATDAKLLLQVSDEIGKLTKEVLIQIAGNRKGGNRKGVNP
jgi:C-terminal processing protease CtpA/Prc